MTRRFGSRCALVLLAVLSDAGVVLAAPEAEYANPPVQGKSFKELSRYWRDTKTNPAGYLEITGSKQQVQMLAQVDELLEKRPAPSQDGRSTACNTRRSDLTYVGEETGYGQC